MHYLLRETAPVSPELWEQIDSTVINTARNILTGRRFLHLFGPLGIGMESIPVDDADSLEEVVRDNHIIVQGRKFVGIPVIYDDFVLLARDLEVSRKSEYPADLSRAAAAAENAALQEDRLIYFGSEELGIQGLLTAEGINKVHRNDWRTGENALTDVAAGIQVLTENKLYGPFALAVSPDLYMQMQRLQEGTGLLEIDRVSKLLNGNIYNVPVLGSGKAVLVCSDPRNMDLVIGQDMTTAYLESRNLNHEFRILETILLRIKRKQAIVVLE